MSETNKKSAKDIAFDKERQKLRKQISELKHLLVEREKLYEEQSKVVDQQQALIDTLTTKMDLSPEDLRTLIESEKKQQEAAKIFARLSNLGLFY